MKRYVMVIPGPLCQDWGWRWTCVSTALGVTASTQGGINTLFPTLAKEKKQWFNMNRNHINQEDRKGKIKMQHISQTAYHRHLACAKRADKSVLTVSP